MLRATRRARAGGRRHVRSGVPSCTTSWCRGRAPATRCRGLPSRPSQPRALPSRSLGAPPLSNACVNRTITDAVRSGRSVSRSQAKIFLDGRIRGAGSGVAFCQPEARLRPVGVEGNCLLQMLDGRVVPPQVLQGEPEPNVVSEVKRLQHQRSPQHFESVVPAMVCPPAARRRRRARRRAMGRGAAPAGTPVPPTSSRRRCGARPARAQHARRASDGSSSSARAPARRARDAASSGASRPRSRSNP